MKRRVAVLALVVLVCLHAKALAAPPSGATLNANPTVAAVDEQVTITGFVGIGTTLPVHLSFGDGSQTIISTARFSLTHSYGRPGVYNVFMTTATGFLLNATAVIVAAPTPKLPLGAIYSTSVTASPVLSGSVINIFVTYRIAVPSGPGAVLAGPLPAFQAIVDLEDANGDLIHRSDPTPVNREDFDLAQNATITYSVPVDAAGAYQLRVFIQAVDRGTVAVGAPITLDVIGNGPGTPVDAAGVHAAGSVEFGHRPQITGEPVNPGITASTQQNVSTSQLGVFSDPISNRVDPLLALMSLMPATLSSPNALDTTPKLPAALPIAVSGQKAQYYDGFGRSMAPMPDIIGGFATIRGLNAVYRTAPGWTFQTSVGNTELYSVQRYQPQTFEQVGDVFELGRFWSDADSVQFFHQGRGDNPSRFLGYPGSADGPQVADVNALQITHGLDRDISVAASGADSRSYANYPSAPFVWDSADVVSAAYHNGLSSATLQYHNFGQSYTPGDGLDAQSDRAGMLATATLPFAKTGQFAFNWDRESTRSAPGTQTITSALFGLGFSHGMDASASVTREREQTDLNDVTTNTVTLNLARSDTSHTFLANGSIVSSHDYVNDYLNTTTRIGSLQYSVQDGIQAVGLGVNATQLDSFFQESTVTESFSDGVAFGGVQRRIGAQVGLANTNVRYGFGFGTVSDDLTGVISYRVARGVTVGFKGERTLFNAHVPQADSIAGGMRFVLIIER
jgi:hypothetical protein